MTDNVKMGRGGLVAAFQSGVWDIFRAVAAVDVRVSSRFFRNTSWMSVGTPLAIDSAPGQFQCWVFGVSQVGEDLALIVMQPPSDHDGSQAK